MKRILSGIFAALLILCALPVAAFAEQQPSDIDPITVQPISASGREIVRPTWLAYGQSPSIPLREEHGNTAFVMQRFDPITPWIVAMAVLLY